jgi:hypothetical protein
MSEVTYYVALPFVPSDEGIVPGEAVECFNPNSAVMKAEALSRKPGLRGRHRLQPQRRLRHRRLRRRQPDPEVRRGAERPERALTNGNLGSLVTRTGSLSRFEQAQRGVDLREQPFDFSAPVRPGIALELLHEPFLPRKQIRDSRHRTSPKF